jgi:protein SCO1/2
MKRSYWPALLLFSVLACERHPPPPSPEPPKVPSIAAHEARPTPAAPLPPETSKPSVFDLEARLTDDTGLSRTLDSFRGHPTLVTMFYGSCAAACPLLTSELKRIERLIPEPERSNVRVLMVSFDEARDTPAALARMKRERASDPSRWTFASASDDDARELAAVLGIRYRKLDNGEFFHSSVIVLLDGAGRPIARLDGLGGDPSPIIAALSRPAT